MPLSTRIWDDLWLADGKSFYPGSNGRPAEGLDMVSDLLSVNGKWDLQKLKSIFYNNSVILKGGALLPAVSFIQREVWWPPPQDWLKLNCDVRVRSESSCIAVVAKNCYGEVVWANTTRLDFSDACCGEAVACCLAI
uniref:RNase H type-1 domain-containing protein n=1 Tax=Cannabis sativa TaxID=3483 RepID=A0A803PPM8_CANSA